MDLSELCSMPAMSLQSKSPALITAEEPKAGSALAHAATATAAWVKTPAPAQTTQISARINALMGAVALVKPQAAAQRIVQVAGMASANLARHALLIAQAKHGVLTA
jgi:hypothetical protein